MAKKQTRRSVSVNRDRYDQLKAHAAATNIPMSQLVEDAITLVLTGAAPSQQNTAAPTPPARPATEPAPGSYPVLAAQGGGALAEACGADAQRWAQAFMEIIGVDGVIARPADEGPAIDEGLMIGWFANAIEYATMVRLRDQRERQAAELEAAGLDSLTASEAVYGFTAWLSTRSRVLEIGASKECSGLVPLVERFTTANKLADPRDRWHERLVHPTHDPALDGVRVSDTTPTVGGASERWPEATVIPDDAPEAEAAPEPELKVVYDEDPNA